MGQHQQLLSAWEGARFAEVARQGLPAGQQEKVKQKDCWDNIDPNPGQGLCQGKTMRHIQSPSRSLCISGLA